MDKKLDVDRIFKQGFHKKGKKDTGSAGKKSGKKVKRIFYITKYSDDLLNEYKELTAVPKSAAVDRIVREYFESRQ